MLSSTLLAKLRAEKRCILGASFSRENSRSRLWDMVSSRRPSVKMKFAASNCCASGSFRLRRVSA